MTVSNFISLQVNVEIHKRIPNWNCLRYVGIYTDTALSDFYMSETRWLIHRGRVMYIRVK